MFNGDCIKSQGYLCKNYLAPQFHPGITKSMVNEWLEHYADCLKNQTNTFKVKSRYLRILTNV